MTDTVNQVIELEAYVNAFTMKPLETEGNLKISTTKLHIPDANVELLAQLCENPQDAQKLLVSASEAGGKAEVPMSKEEFVTRLIQAGKVRCENDRATFKKLTYDGSTNKAQVEYAEPLSEEVVSFWRDYLQAVVGVQFEQMQKELEFPEGEAA